MSCAMQVRNRLLLKFSKYLLRKQKWQNKITACSQHLDKTFAKTFLLFQTCGTFFAKILLTSLFPKVNIRLYAEVIVFRR